MPKAKEVEKKLTEKEFVLTAIKTLRTEKSKGIHSTFTGFNDAFKKYFGYESKEATKRLQKEGIIEIVPSFRGVRLYLANEAPKGNNKGSDALKKMGLKK